MTTKTDWLHGHLCFHSETGTEGGYWAFQDERFSYYDGLYILRSGDELQVYLPDINDWFDVGVLDFPERQDPYAEGSYSAQGMAAHFAPPSNVTVVANWEEVFFRGYEAKIRVADGSFPRKDPDTI